MDILRFLDGSQNHILVLKEIKTSFKLLKNRNKLDFIVISKGTRE